MVYKNPEDSKRYYREHAAKIYARNEKRRKENHGAWLIQKRKHYAKNRERLLGEKKERTDSSFRNYLQRILSTTKSFEKKVKQRECDLDVEYLLDLLRIQGERCAGFGIKMTHRRHDIRAVSIDRIDSTKGHVRGNTQLVSQAFNFMKNDWLDEEAKGIVEEIQLDLLKKLKEQGYLKPPISGVGPIGEQ